jgi:hypothetical protein
MTEDALPLMSIFSKAHSSGCTTAAKEHRGSSSEMNKMARKDCWGPSGPADEGVSWLVNERWLVKERWLDKEKSWLVKKRGGL